MAVDMLRTPFNRLFSDTKFLEGSRGCLPSSGFLSCRKSETTGGLFSSVVVNLFPRVGVLLALLKRAFLADSSLAFMLFVMDNLSLLGAKCYLLLVMA